MVSSRIKKPPLRSLPYMKKRLRRITALGLRNLTVNEFNFTIHFTLHRNETTVAFYTSETIENQRSPEWSYLHFPLSVQSIQDFLMRIWMTTSNKTRLFLEYDIHLDDSLMPEEQKDDTFSPNDSLWIEMFGYRFSDSQNQMTLPIVNLSEKKSRRDRPDKSYDKSSLERLIGFVNDIRETNQSSREHLERLQAVFNAKEDYLSKVRERESQLVRIANLKQHIVTQISTYERGLNSNEYRQKLLDERKNRHEQNLLLLLSQKERLNFLVKNLYQSQCLLHDLSELITFRQSDLISEIYRYIYPIVRERKNEYTIANIKLPLHDERGYSPSIIREHENEILAAIGFCAHIVLLISKILHLPLRYPIEFCPTSSIKIHDSSFHGLSEYALSPISGNGSFDYGLFLLNKNIGQILIHRCHVTSRIDSRKTLENLKTILDRYSDCQNSIQLFASTQQSIEMNKQSNSRTKSLSYPEQAIIRNKTVNSIFSPRRSAVSSMIETDDEHPINDKQNLIEEFPTFNTISPRLAMQISQQQ